MILDRINGANDIKNIAPEELSALADELRQYIVENVASNGGHLSSSLGVIELTMALHLFMDLPKDKIIWDVGHQAYAHKILTGRKEEFKSLRNEGGMSGFPNIQESEYDSFGVGHASTSISAAMGYVSARELRGTDEKVVAVIGDGAMTGGLAFEALNNAGNLNSNLIIILNDNDMSISRNVGGLSKVFNKLRTDKKYNELKYSVKNHLSKIPVYGDNMINKIHKTKSSIKQFFVPGMIFEDLGITYLGPIDGHDINKIGKMLRLAANVDHAVLIHINTQKGRGYRFAEKRPSFYHGVDPFNVETGELLNRKRTKTYSDVFSRTITSMAAEDDKIVAITAAMADGCGLKKFEKQYPDRFFDVGIAEEHAVTFAAGLAAAGYKPYVAIYSSFLQRSFDQILHDVCIQNLPVRFIIERSGIVGKDGITHQGIFDISYMSMIPNMTILSPRNQNELVKMLEYSKDYNGPIAIRFPRGAVSDICNEVSNPIEYGRSEYLRQGKDVLILSVGNCAEVAFDIADELKNSNVNAAIADARFVKPIDTELLDSCEGKYSMIVTVEENVRNGGYGLAVLNYMNEKGSALKVYNASLRDEFIEHGSPDSLKKKHGLDSTAIAAEIVRRLG